MTRFLGILLAVLICGLCALCAKQWVRETTLRTSLSEVDARLKTEQETRQGLEDKLGSWEKEIKQLTQRLDEQGAKIASQEQAALALRDQFTAEKNRADGLAKKLASRTGAVEQSKEAMEAQNAAVAAQNATIEKQNQMLKDLVIERDGVVEKLNARTREFNSLMEKYNTLAKAQ